MRRWLEATAFFGAALLTVTHARADQILMRSGGRIEGVVVEQTPTAVVIETGPGRVTLAMARVARVVRSHSSLDTWRERSSGLDPRDARGWDALARWAAGAGLSTQAAEAWERALAADPHNAEANRGLGRMEVDGAWLPRDEAYRARGYVLYEGRWVPQEERDALVRERAADEAATLQRQEAGLRTREAEARAREAEARAREAEASGAQAADNGGGIPLWIAYGGGGYGAARPYGHGYGSGPRQTHAGGVRHPVPTAGGRSTEGRGQQPAPMSSSLGPSGSASTSKPAGALPVRPRD